MKPFVKWAGGKRQILGKINAYVHDSIASDTDKACENTNYTYIEPF